MVPVPMAVVVNGDDARGRGFLLPNAQGLRRADGTYKVQRSG